MIKNLLWKRTKYTIAGNIYVEYRHISQKNKVIYQIYHQEAADKCVYFSSIIKKEHGHYKTIEDGEKFEDLNSAKIYFYNYENNSK